MEIGMSETLLDLIDQIAFKRTAVWTRSGTLGFPDIKEEEMTASYKPLILPGILGRPVRSTHTYPARIVPGVPDTAKEHAGLALCNAIVRAEDRDVAMMKIVGAFGNRVCGGGKLDSTALAEIIAETYEHLMQKEDLSKREEHADGLHLITHHFRTMVASAYKELVLDEWEAILNKPASLTSLINTSSFYGYLHSCGMVRSWEFLETLDVILDEYTSGSLDLLMVAVIYLMSRATLNLHARRVIPRKYWNTVLGQLNDIEGRHQKGRRVVGDRMDEDVVEMLCGNPPSTSTHEAPLPQAKFGAPLSVLAEAHRAAEAEWDGFRRLECRKTSSSATAIGRPPDPTASHPTGDLHSKSHSRSGSDSDMTVVEGQSKNGTTDLSSKGRSTMMIPENFDSDMPEPIDPNDPNEVYVAAIDTLRDFISEFLDADTAACIFRAPWWRTGFVEFCLDPPSLRSNKAKYMIKLCERIKKWANVKGVETEMSWGIILEELGDGYWNFEQDDEQEKNGWRREVGAKRDGLAVGGGRKHPPTIKEEGDDKWLVIPVGRIWAESTSPTPAHEIGESLIRERRGVNVTKGPLRVDTTLKEEKHRQTPHIGPTIQFIDPRIAGNRFERELLKTHQVIWRLNPVDNFFHPYGVKRAEMGGVEGRTAEEWAALCDETVIDPLTCVG